MRFRQVLTVLLFLLLFFPCKALADNNSFITIVNPVRVSTYTLDLATNIKTQYSELQKRDLPSTWLLTYDVLQKPKILDIFKDFDDKQEFGLFVEVTPALTKKAGVVYNQTNAWHRATSLFLSGYTQSDRKKLIDTYFKTFKEKFDYYPKSVGSWWTDSYSLSYMKEKYGITGTLGVSDQFDLDGYQVWGTFWSLPYYPSKINAAAPASSMKDKLGIVTYRWAPRDPLNGYLSPTANQGSLYSTQDYNKLGLTNDYFASLVKLYSERTDVNKFAQATVGLEADYSPDIYSEQYSQWLDIVKQEQAEGVEVTNMSEFSDWYIKTFPSLSPSHVISSNDLLNTQKQIFWINNDKYRAGILYNPKNNNASIVDLRIYNENFEEPNYSVPNKLLNLSINLPFVIDSVINEQGAWNFNAGELKSASGSANNYRLTFSKGSISFTPDQISVKGIKLPDQISESSAFNIQQKNGQDVLSIRNNYPIGKSGILYSDYSIHIPFSIYHRIDKFLPFAILFGIVLLILFVSMMLIKYGRRGGIVVLILAVLSAVLFLILGNTKYYISQTEYDALLSLASFPEGRVLAYSRDCLQCDFSTVKPAAAAGKKGYVAKYSKQPIIYDTEFQVAANSSEARQILETQKIKYIYLPRYESYVEILPYLPQDLGLKRVYENANAEIWEVNEK